MTQIFANASLIDTSAIESSQLRLFLILAVVSAIIGIITGKVFSRKEKYNLSIASYTIGLVLGVILVFVGVGNLLDSFKESENISNTKIAQFIQEKYGVTVLNDQNIETGIHENSAVTPLSIPAKAPNGERIQITIELSEDGTDVLAFSSGAEMKKVSK